MQLKTNIIGLFLISVFIGCGIFESNEDISVSDKVYVALQGADTVRVVNFETGTLESIAINYDIEGNEPHFIAIDEVNRYWFVTAFKSGWVARYNLDTNELIDKTTQIFPETSFLPCPPCEFAVLSSLRHHLSPDTASTHIAIAQHL